MATAVLPKHSLKVRITLATLFVLLVSIWSLSFWAIKILRKDIEGLLGEQQSSTIHMVAAQTDYEMTLRLEALTAAAQILGPAMQEGSIAVQAFLEQRHDLKMLFNAGVFVTQMDGTRIAKAPYSGEEPHVNYMDRDYIKSALVDGKATIGRPTMGKTLHAPVVVLASPIYDTQGHVIGALAGTTNLATPNFLDRLIENRYGKNGGFLLIAPQYRMVVAATERNHVVENLPAPGINPTIDRFVDGHEGSVVFKNPQGVEVLSSVTKIPFTGWHAVAVLPTSEAFAPVRDIEKGIVVATLLLSFLSATFIWMWLKRQLAPLQSASRRLTAMTDEGLPLEALSISRWDEIGQMVHSFNRLLETLRIRETHQRALIDNFPFMVWLKDKEGKYLTVNRYHAEVCGVPTVDQSLGKTDFDFFPQEQASAFQADDWAVLKSGKPKTIEELIQVKGKNTWFETYKSPIILGEDIVGTVGFARDITEHKRAAEKINELAFFDQLTNLPNRKLLLDRLRQSMSISSRSGRYGALLLIDLDNFKVLNDTLGHDIGDLLLKQVALRLVACVRPDDTVARLGGDEFVVILIGLSELESDAAAQVEIIGKKIITALSQSYQLEEITYQSTLSIGANLYRGQGIESDILLKQADIAMYRSKTDGGNALRFFDPDMEAAVMRRAALEKDLHEAIVEKQFIVHYQAQMSGDQLVGAEALVRWQHPRRGRVPPGDFIPLAEDTGLILLLGAWVLETACSQLAVWAEQPETAHLTIAVNVSAHQFRQDSFVEQVLAILQDTKANPENLKLELTESMLVSNVDAVIEKMITLKALGVCFSLDDFGTGYSSLSYLKRMPLDQLKIDQSFVRDVLVDSNDAAIARTIVSLAESLGFGVIAEGVETAAQRDYLLGVGCHSYQGYFFGRPQPVDDFERFAQQNWLSTVN